MSVTESSTTRGRLRRFLALAAIAVALTLAGALGLLAYSARAVDEQTARAEEALVARTLDRRLEKVGEDVTSATIWDDAWVNVVDRYNADWVDLNFGQYYAEYMGHDRTLLFNAADEMVYASKDGEQSPLDEQIRAFARTMGPALADVRKGEGWLARHGRAADVGFDGNATRRTIIAAEGSFWLVAASTITPETQGVRTTQGPAPVVISARKVGMDFLTGLEQDLGIGAPRVARADEVVDGPGAPLLDASGRRLAQVTWTPARPGGRVMMEVAPLFAVALLLIIAIGSGLLWNVLRSLSALSANDERLARTLAELTAARDRAEAASVAKSQFLANISHEIRTPLNGVLGMAQIMAKGELDNSQRERLGIIRDSGATLLGILNDVLDLAKIEAGKLEISRQDVDLPSLIASASEPFRAAAVEKGLAFGVLVEPDAVGVWRVDAMRVSQVLGNLLSNAVKFTAKGHVSARVWRSERGLEFAVMDTGPGIPEDRLAELFGKFNQLDASTTRQYGGTGLGLAICRELVELMDGRLEVDSRVGHGSWFTFWLPAEPAQGNDRIAA